MAENLVIVESPAKAKTIAKLLGKGYKVEASMGHIRDLPKSQIGVDIEHDFTPKYINIRGKGDLISKLKKEAKAAGRVLLATDPDREGEAISWHLATLLNLNEKEKCRISFNEITKNAVKNAIKSPRKINQGLVNAQQARRVLDRIVGYKISPVLWKKVKKGLSAGRVQSVATRLICDREREIQEFKPEEFWSITAKLADSKTATNFEAKFYGTVKDKMELKNEQQVNSVLEGLKKSSYLVQKVKKGEKKRTPAPPFITSTLQQEAARKLGFTTKRTMMVAQQLYEGIEIKGHGAIGLISYMRTDSTRIAQEAQAEARNFIEGKFGKEYIPDEVRQYKNRSAAQDAHEAIRPTYITMDPASIKESLNNDQFKVYKLIWDRFIASQMASAVYDTVSAEIEASGYLFKASGSRVKFPGFILVYTESKDEETEEKDTDIPELGEGEEVKLKKLDPKQHFTQPPARYTEATLVKVLEEKGIGRPSTYATIISTIIDRGYVVRDKKNLLPTEIGKIVNDIMEKHFPDIVDVQFTAQMENKLDDIEEEDKAWVEVLKEFYSPFSNALTKAESEIQNVEVPVEVSDVPCEKCGRMMVIKMGRFGKFLACPGFPECRNAKPITQEAGVACPKCSGKVLIKKSKKGRIYYGCENNPKCDFMTWDAPTEDKCPNCGNFLMKKVSGKKSEIKCSNDKCEYTKTERE